MTLGIALVLLLVAALAAGLWWLFFLALPPARGTFELPGLAAPVQVTRDGYGVPHIRAGSIADAAMALGYCHAQDRLWNLELNRRVAGGRLSELFGPMPLEADRYLRRLGLRRAAEAEAAQLHPEERRILEAYAAGVNEAARALADRRPLEFRLLGLEWEPWTPADTLAWGKVLALNLATNAENEAFRARTIDALGPERAAKVEPAYPSGHPVAIPPGSQAGDSLAELAKLYDDAKQYLPLGQTGASNNWVLAGSRTASGTPIVCNDPHLTLTAPGIWYEAHLVAQREGASEPELDVYGVTLPGTPAVVLGHNRHVAWGFTNSGADVQDLYLERLNPANPDEVEFQGALEPLRVIREVIRVRGADEVVEEVRITRHGPIMAGGPGKPGPAVALRWTALEPSHGPLALLRMNTARSAAEFREALKLWSDPSQNVVFADRENIGFVMAGRVPIRARGSGLTPVPGWSGEYEWVGNVPFDELPQAWNPAEGQIVTANNAIVGREFPHHITWDWMAGHRAAQIERRLSALEKVTPEDCARIQMDTHTAPGAAFAKLCQPLEAQDPLERRALKELKAWDGNASAESVGAMVYEAMMLAVAQRALQPVLGPQLTESFLGKSEFPLAPAGLMVGRYTAFLLGLLQANDERLWEGLSPKPTWREVLQGALSDAVKQLRAQLGDEVAAWKWGALHQVRIRHPMSAAPLLGRLFDGPTAPIGGDADTPLQTAVIPHKPFAAEAWAPSWRQITDLGNRRAARTVLPMGQSGLPRSRHWADQFPLWLSGRLKPALTHPDDIAADARAVMRLIPAAQ